MTIYSQYEITLVLQLTSIGAKKKTNSFFITFYENDVEMFGIMVGQNSSAQYALYFIEIG